MIDMRSIERVMVLKDGVKKLVIDDWIDIFISSFLQFHSCCDHLMYLCQHSYLKILEFVLNILVEIDF